MTAIADTARFSRKPSVIETDLDAELVLLDPETREMYSLNPVGRAVWRALPELTVAAHAAALTQAFDVEYERALADVQRLLGDLLDADLIALVPDAG
jgi:Coenzyme PQQ synthesis protein D (PqqD)